jgi:hypothetical protein
MGPILGALFGAFVYDAVLYTGEENIVTRSFVIFYSLFYLLNLIIRGDHIRQRFLHRRSNSAQRILKADDAV